MFIENLYSNFFSSIGGTVHWSKPTITFSKTTLKRILKTKAHQSFIKNSQKDPILKCVDHPLVNIMINNQNTLKTESLYNSYWKIQNWIAWNSVHLKKKHFCWGEISQLSFIHCRTDFNKFANVSSPKKTFKIMLTQEKFRSFVKFQLISVQHNVSRQVSQDQIGSNLSDGNGMSWLLWVY